MNTSTKPIENGTIYIPIKRLITESDGKTWGMILEVRGKGRPPVYEIANLHILESIARLGSLIGCELKPSGICGLRDFNINDLYYMGDSPNSPALQQIRGMQPRIGSTFRVEQRLFSGNALYGYSGTWLTGGPALANPSNLFTLTKDQFRSLVEAGGVVDCIVSGNGVSGTNGLQLRQLPSEDILITEPNIRITAIYKYATSQNIRSMKLNSATGNEAIVGVEVGYKIQNISKENIVLLNGNILTPDKMVILPKLELLRLLSDQGNSLSNGYVTKSQVTGLELVKLVDQGSVEKYRVDEIIDNQQRLKSEYAGLSEEVERLKLGEAQRMGKVGTREAGKVEEMRGVGHGESTTHSDPQNHPSPQKQSDSQTQEELERIKRTTGFKGLIGRWKRR